MRYNLPMDNVAKIHYSNCLSLLTDSDKNFFDTDKIELNSYWSGVKAESERHSFANLLWNEDCFFARFVCNQGETLIINDKPSLTKKAIGLWNFDVCEIFIAPNITEPAKYFEFEVSPTGEWLDLGIHQLSDKRETNWEYQSNMQVFAEINQDKIILAIQIPWQAFGKKPVVGEKWRGNLFRCVGSGENRGYLAWQPTLTKEPNFHVPEKFGWFEFVK